MNRLPIESNIITFGLSVLASFQSFACNCVGTIFKLFHLAMEVYLSVSHLTNDSVVFEQLKDGNWRMLFSGTNFMLWGTWRPAQTIRSEKSDPFEVRRILGSRRLTIARITIWPRWWFTQVEFEMELFHHATEVTSLFTTTIIMYK